MHDRVGPPSARSADIVEDALEHLQQKSSGAACKVEHGHALIIGEPIANIEILLQDVVHRADDEVDDGRRSVIDTPAFAGLLVVDSQIAFIEIDEWVALEEAM